MAAIGFKTLNREKDKIVNFTDLPRHRQAFIFNGDLSIQIHTPKPSSLPLSDEREKRRIKEWRKGWEKKDIDAYSDQ